MEVLGLLKWSAGMGDGSMADAGVRHKAAEFLQIVYGKRS